MLKCILRVIFTVISMVDSIGQDEILKPIDVRIYFQSVSFTTQQNIPSSVVIYDTYYNIVDSITVLQKGLYLN